MDMKILGLFGRRVTGTILMFMGVLLMFVVITFPIITEMVFGNIFANLILGITLLVIGFGIFTDSTKLPKRQKKERIHQKSKHEFIEIFGLE